jgi:SAM-dependent methyltransferase
VSSRWLEGNVTGASYDERMARLAAAGTYLHGEADLVWHLLGFGADAGAEGDEDPVAGRLVLDAGCGTGRVAIELARRGLAVTGIDLDPSMLAVAKNKAPALDWRQADLADPTLDVGRRFHLALAAGNVMIFLAAGTEPATVRTLARHLRPGGLLVAGFQLQPGRLSLGGYDDAALTAGLVLRQRWATWERGPWVEGGDYAVSVHQLEPG